MGVVSTLEPQHCREEACLALCKVRQDQKFEGGEGEAKAKKISSETFTYRYRSSPLHQVLLLGTQSAG